MSENVSKEFLDPPKKIKQESWLRINPVLIKELRSRMRGNRAFVLLTVYLSLMALIVGLVYLGYVTSSNLSPIGLINTRQLIGKSVLWVVVGMELVSISLIAPGLLAGAISSEREYLTYDLLQTTLLSASEVVLGKYFSGLVFMILLLFVSLPLQSMAFLFGGVALEEVLISALILLMTASLFCATSLFFSSSIKSTLISTVLAYAIPFLSIYVIPLIIFIFSPLITQAISALINNNSFAPLGELVLIVVGWILVSINPISAMITTEGLLISNHILIVYPFPLQNGGTFQILSPWIPYAIFCFIFSLVMLFWSVTFVRKMAK